MKRRSTRCGWLLMLAAVAILALVAMPHLGRSKPVAGQTRTEPPLAGLLSVLGIGGGLSALQNRSIYFRQGMRRVKQHVDTLHMLLRDEALAPDEDGFFALHKAARKKAGKLNYKYLRRGGEQLLSAKEKDIEHDTIFVSVAAYRDAECGQTVEDLFLRAAFPQRIFVGIVQQRWPSRDVSCTTPLLANCTNRSFCPTDNIRIRHVLPDEARGPTFGRYVAGLMYQDEKYFMMLDSHSRMVFNWDVLVIKHYRMLPTKGVISFYPPGYDNVTTPDRLSTTHVTFMCSSHWTASNILRMDGEVMEKPMRPILHPYTAAGFLFGHASFVREVPFDPHLDFISDGEEITYTIRLWTSGWDAYMPPDSVVYHNYERHNASRFWEIKTVDWGPIEKLSEKRVHAILKTTIANTTTPLVELAIAEPEVLVEIEKYGLGRERKVEDYWKFARVDPVVRKTGVKIMTYCDMVR